jgi:hypothetical protein
MKIIDSAAKPLGAEMCLKKYHQNTFAKNKDGLYAILKRRVWTLFSSNIKNGGFCSRIDNLSNQTLPVVQHELNKSFFPKDEANGEGQVGVDLLQGRFQKIVLLQQPEVQNPCGFGQEFPGQGKHLCQMIIGRMISFLNLGISDKFAQLRILAHGERIQKPLNGPDPPVNRTVFPSLQIVVFPHPLLLPVSQ